IFFCLFCFFFFFFKQKTAYEMRISDWSSDVCSSDLRGHLLRQSQSLVSQDREARTQDHAGPAPQGGGRPARPGLRGPQHRHLEEDAGRARHGRALPPPSQRSEERSVGKESVSTCRYRWSP